MSHVGTKHFSRAEYERSAEARRRGISNRIPEHLEAAAQRTLEMAESARCRLGVPLHVESGHRCMVVNMAVGGAPKSQHMKCEAIDVRSDYHTPAEVADAFAVDLHDQIITYDWLTITHASIREDNNRRQRLHSPAPGVYHEVPHARDE